MEELFKNKTKCTKKEYDDFLKLQEKEGAVSNLLYTLFNFSFFGMCLILAILNKEILLSIILAIGLIIYGWFKFIRPERMINKEKNSKMLVQEFTNTYIFYKHYFTTENPEGQAQTYYFKINKVIETKEYFYIYLSKEYAFIIDKEGFENCSCQEFKKFIQNKVKLKYKTKTA